MIGYDKEGMGFVEIDGIDVKYFVLYEDGFLIVDDCYNMFYDFGVICKFDNGVEMNVISCGDNGIFFEGIEGCLFVNWGKIMGKLIEENWDEGKYLDEDVVVFYKGKFYEGYK